MSLPQDKKLHAAAGLIVWVAALMLGASLIQATGLSALAGLAKEVHDKVRPGHTVDPLDWFWTSWPAAVFSVLGAFAFR